MKPRARRCPQMRLHSRLLMAYLAYKVHGRRRVVYLGKWASRQAAVRYAAFCRAWPSQLSDPAPSGGRWPAARLLTHEGRTQTLAKWATEVGLKASTLKHRLDVAGWELERALATPTRHCARRPK